MSERHEERELSRLRAELAELRERVDALEAEARHPRWADVYQVAQHIGWVCCTSR